ETEPDLLHTLAEWPPPHCLDEVVEQMPPVEHWNGQEVENADVQGQQRHEIDERHDSERGHLPRDLSDLDRPPELIDVAPADEEIPKERGGSVENETHFLERHADGLGRTRPIDADVGFVDGLSHADAPDPVGIAEPI